MMKLSLSLLALFLVAAVHAAPRSPAVIKLRDGFQEGPAEPANHPWQPPTWFKYSIPRYPYTPDYYTSDEVQNDDHDIYDYGDETHGTNSDETHGTNSDETSGTDSDETRGFDSDKTRGTNSDETRGTNSDETRSSDSDKTRGSDSDETRGSDSDETRGTNIVKFYRDMQHQLMEDYLHLLQELTLIDRLRDQLANNDTFHYTDLDFSSSEDYSDEMFPARDFFFPAIGLDRPIFSRFPVTPNFPNVDDLPDNYDNSTHEVHEVNGTHLEVNTTTNKKSEDGFKSFFHHQVIAIRPQDDLYTTTSTQTKKHGEKKPTLEEKRPTLPEVLDDKLPSLPEVLDEKLPTLPEVLDDKLPTLPEVLDDKLPTLPEVLDEKLPTLPEVENESGTPGVAHHFVPLEENEASSPGEVHPSILQEDNKVQPSQVTTTEDEEGRRVLRVARRADDDDAEQVPGDDDAEQVPGDDDDKRPPPDLSKDTRVNHLNKDHQGLVKVDRNAEIFNLTLVLEEERKNAGDK